MPDVFESLKDLDQDASVQPLPAGDVRRRGDRMRRRRIAVQSVAAVAAVAVVATAGLLGGGNLRTGPGPGPAPTTRHATPEPTVVTIPAALPLGSGYQDSGVHGVLVGPSRSPKAAFEPIEACGKRGYPVVTPTDRLSVQLRQPEGFRGREVTTYADTAQAVRAFNDLVSVLRDCPRETTGGSVVQTRARPVVGGDATWLFTTTGDFGAHPSSGPQLLTVSRIDNAVLVTRQPSRGTRADAGVQVDEAMSAVRALLDELVLPGFIEADEPSLGPDGYGALRLTMDADQAQRAGLRLDRGTGGACRTGRLGKALVYISRTYGVAGIFLGKGMRTQEGIGLGSTQASLLKAYPQARRDAKGSWVVEPSAGVRLRIAAPHGVVDEVGLSLADQDCFG